MTELFTEYTRKAGIWITANDGSHIETESGVPDGFFAAVGECNGPWFAVDVAGNVRGYPEAVEREALTLNPSENLMAAALVGLSRLALRASRR